MVESDGCAIASDAGFSRSLVRSQYSAQCTKGNGDQLEVLPVNDAESKTKIPMNGGSLVLALICFAVLPIATAQSQTKQSPSRKAASDQSSKHSNANDAGLGASVLSGHTEPVSSLAFSPDGKLLASGGGYHDTTVKVWSVQTKRLIWTLTGHRSTVTALAFSPDSRRLASGGHQVIRLWDVQSGKLLSVLEGGEKYIYSIAFSPDGTKLATGSDGDLILLWDVHTGRQLWAHTVKGTGVVGVLVFSPDTKTLISRGGDQDLGVWDVRTGQIKRTLKPLGGATALLFGPDPTTLLLASVQIGEGWVVRLYDTEAWSERSRLSGFSHPVARMALSSDGSALAVVEAAPYNFGSPEHRFDRRVSIWDLHTGRLRQVLISYTSADADAKKETFALSADGSAFASGRADNTIRLHILKTR